MNRKLRTTARRGLKTPLFTLLVGVACTLAIAGFSSAATQSQSKPTLRIVSEDGNRLPVVIITGDDIRNLPSGKTYIIGGANGGVWKTTNGGQSTDLTKTGAGTLTLANANSSSGITKEGVGVLRNSADNTTGLTKELTGTLILSAVAGVVYEFRNMSETDLDRIAIDNESTSVAARISGLKKLTATLRSEKSMTDWPPSRILLLPAKGIAKIEGMQPGVTSNPKPASKFECRDGLCLCNGHEDCFKLTQSGSCSSGLTCAALGNNIGCWCPSR